MHCRPNDYIDGTRLINAISDVNVVKIYSYVNSFWNIKPKIGTLLQIEHIFYITNCFKDTLKYIRCLELNRTVTYVQKEITYILS